MSFKTIAHLLLVVAAAVLIQPATGFALSFDIKMSPEHPAPNQPVHLSVSALEFNMDLSTISWTVDGKLKDSGLGKKSISLVAPANGLSTTVLIKVIPNIGGAVQNTITISSGELDLIWEATDSYVPPFYRGKALPISQGSVKVAAIPNMKSAAGASKPASAFAYTWRKDGKNMPATGGFGKSSFNFTNQILDKQNRIEVSVTDGTKTASSSITVTPFVPEILFYEDYSLTGVQYQNALGAVHEISDRPRVTIVAEPYFLSKNFKTNNDIKGTWTLNGQAAETSKKNTLAINTSGTTGAVAVYFAYDDIRKLFRDFTGSVNLNIK